MSDTGMAVNYAMRGLLARLKLYFQRGDMNDARYSTLSPQEVAAIFTASAERASKEGDLLYFEICTMLQRLEAAAPEIEPQRSYVGRERFEKLEQIEHAAWHAIEACEERDDCLVIPLEEGLVLSKLLPEDHPGNDEQQTGISGQPT